MLFHGAACGAVPTALTAHTVCRRGQALGSSTSPELPCATCGCLLCAVVGESQLRHPTLLLLWRYSTLNICLLVMEPFPFNGVQNHRKAFYYMLCEWIVSVYPHFPTSAESYCILSRKTGMKYLIFGFFLL